MKKDTSQEARNPDLNDMFIAGLELRDVVAFQHTIKAHPEILSDEWWLALGHLVCDTGKQRVRVI